MVVARAGARGLYVLCFIGLRWGVETTNAQRLCVSNCDRREIKIGPEGGASTPGRWKLGHGKGLNIRRIHGTRLMRERLRL